MAAIYAVVRIADDMADEACAESASRAHAIQDWEAQLLRAVDGERANHWALRACAVAIRRHRLDVRCFQSLFRAFLRDTQQSRYERFEDLLEYCRDSANPVGRLVIGLIEPSVATDAVALEASDALCTGLQLVNHWQDVREDASRGRIYLPRTERTRFGVDETSLLAGTDSPQLRALMAFEVSRARAFLDRGSLLITKSHGRLRVEAALFRRAGLQACRVLERNDYDVMGDTSRIKPADRLRIAGQGLSDALLAPMRPSWRHEPGSIAPSATPPESR